ncbi:putative metal-dependent HD superfamily phosphohydrolase [Flavobacterium sp. 103]|uniref:Pycsar system effector family protein n=1 Tax=Flavobacterium sp. 103 TaxID=2135624 RepID=UPI000D5F9F7D|nr:Pycsar system effector family protein [Flavobacterium sp. 103]PVX47407.1 putative metal-dependent HD superfamily phosphohydrolase [Flavobacterium sp. 103]
MTLVNQVQDFVSNLLESKLSGVYTYHNLNHTTGVVNAVNRLCDEEKISLSDKEILLIAAWFHDTGYTNGCQNHEDSSAKIATHFLKEKGKTEEYIAKVSGLIKATAKEYVPQNLLEKIIKDADYYHVLNDDYIFECEGLRKEWENVEGKLLTDIEWAKENELFLSKIHQFYTPYAIEHWKPLKEKNIKRLRKKIKKMSEELPKGNKRKKKEEKPERGIDTLFRVTLGNHTRLSGIADSKANILLSVNAIIISIALSTLIPKLDSPKNVHLVVPTFIMLMSSVITIIFAILSTRPKVTKGVFTKKDIEDKKVNLLFFGNFYKMPLEDYKWAMNEMMKDREYLYNSMIKDLYYLGIVLEKKYRLLRIAYNIFMIGIVLSVIAFVVAFKTIGG